ncbi:hypothetical protein ATANTOWER_022728 [Ataeniobius toweri]|uniref:Secreted protein n=1 Tax=Ataeniobius toweri TaxID=208326 RepID=A0ABU7BWI6_9TELE|nr:hypothetical protein [Ataeniobius toweri]
MFLAVLLFPWSFSLGACFYFEGSHPKIRSGSGRLDSVRNSVPEKKKVRLEEGEKMKRVEAKEVESRGWWRVDRGVDGWSSYAYFTILLYSSLHPVKPPQSSIRGS